MSIDDQRNHETHNDRLAITDNFKITWDLSYVSTPLMTRSSMGRRGFISPFML